MVECLNMEFFSRGVLVDLNFRFVQELYRSHRVVVVGIDDQEGPVLNGDYSNHRQLDAVQGNRHRDTSDDCRCEDLVLRNWFGLKVRE